MNALHKVLVVDDDPVVGKSFDRVLSGKGYAVIVAHDGEEALAKLNAEDYDVVYTDIRMPGMDGLEVAERVKAKRPWLPVVIVTGYGTADNEAKAGAVGVSGFLHKPLSPEMIEGSARKALLERDAAAAPRTAAEPIAASEPPAAGKEGVLKNAARFAKNVALFFAAPFIGLAYAVAFPFIGIGMMAWMGMRALAKKYSAVRNTGIAVKNVAMFVAAPLIGLAYVIVLPFIGLGVMAWIGAKALVKRAGPE